MLETSQRICYSIFCIGYLLSIHSAERLQDEEIQEEGGVILGSDTIIHFLWVISDD